jgi:hypothetical protein
MFCVQSTVSFDVRIPTEVLDHPTARVAAQLPTEALTVAQQLDGAGDSRGIPRRNKHGGIADDTLASDVVCRDDRQTGRHRLE